MPRVYRSMKKDGERPLIEDSATGLGVRIGKGKDDDIAPDSSGNVDKGSGGMSVAPTLHDLPGHRIPRRLRDRIPWADGSNNCYVWRLGDGPFVDAAVAEGLELLLNTETHGVIAPAARMHISEYQTALCRTQDRWIVDEG